MSRGRFIAISCFLVLAVSGIIALLTSGLLGFQLFQLEWKSQGKTDLSFSEVSLPYKSVSDITDGTGSLPFIAGIAFDLDGDGTDEVLIGGGGEQADGLFSFDAASNAFILLPAASALRKPAGDTTMGGVSLDFDGNGDTDVMLARESGLWLYMNNGGALTGTKLPLEINDTSTPLSISLGDVNGDGWADLYVSGYIKNNLVEGQTVFNRPYGGYSHFFLATGPTSWREATEEYGLKRQHNTFTAVFADIDNDNDADLVIAQDTGLVETYENTGTAPFKPLANPSEKSYPMGVAAGYLNDDALVDFYFSNVGHTLPAKLLRGDLPKDVAFNADYMLYETGPGPSFTDTARANNVGRLGFGWGVVAADMNLDGLTDLLAAQNYAKFGNRAIVHRYEGKLLQNYGEAGFKPVEKKTGVGNQFFGITPLVGDYNGDNLPDLVWVNLNGPAKAFLNTTTDRKMIVLDLPETAASLNARIEVKTNERTVYHQVITSQGLSSDQTHKIMIGLGDADIAETVNVTFANGQTLNASNVTSGSTLFSDYSHTVPQPASLTPEIIEETSIPANEEE